MLKKKLLLVVIFIHLLFSFIKLESIEVLNRMKLGESTAKKNQFANSFVVDDSGVIYWGEENFIYSFDTNSILKKAKIVSKINKKDKALFNQLISVNNSFICAYYNYLLFLEGSTILKEIPSVAVSFDQKKRNYKSVSQEFTDFDFKITINTFEKIIKEKYTNNQFSDFISFNDTLFEVINEGFGRTRLNSLDCESMKYSEKFINLDSSKDYSLIGVNDFRIILLEYWDDTHFNKNYNYYFKNNVNIVVLDKEFRIIDKINIDNNIEVNKKYCTDRNINWINGLMFYYQYNINKLYMMYYDKDNFINVVVYKLD